MSKKILIYGLAFGSACAALNYLNFSTEVYKDHGIKKLLFFLGEWLFIPSIGIFLFVKSYRDENPEKFMIGRVVFLGFFVSIMIGCTVSLIYSYFQQFSPKYINNALNYSIAIVKAQANEQHKTLAELNNGISNTRNSFKASEQFIFQLFLGGSRGLFFSAIFGYFLRPKTTIPAAN